MVIGKHIKKIYLIIFILVICSASAYVYFYNKDKPQYPSEPDVKVNRYNRVQSTGFSINHNDDNNNKLIFIKGDKLTVEKKKIGIFRTSLLNEAKVSNATIDLYGTVIGLHDPSGTTINKNIISFRKAFSASALSSFVGKGVSSISIEPVEINLYMDNSLVTKISARAGSVRMKQRVMIFTGDVVVESGTSKLTTGSLTFNPDEAILKTNTKYEFMTQEGLFKGNQFQSNIYLQSDSKGT